MLSKSTSPLYSEYRSSLAKMEKKKCHVEEKGLDRQELVIWVVWQKLNGVPELQQQEEWQMHQKQREKRHVRKEFLIALLNCTGT